MIILKGLMAFVILYLIFCILAIIQIYVVRSMWLPEFEEYMKPFGAKIKYFFYAPIGISKKIFGEMGSDD